MKNIPNVRKIPQKDGRNPGTFATVVPVLAAVVAAALLIPQGIFMIQDEILYKRTEVSRRDSKETELLGSNYEQSMHKRMADFAEGLAEGDRFYVTARMLTHQEDLREYLYSVKGLYQDMIAVLAELDLLYTVFWDYEPSVSQWKKYVIYTDDYAKGVNFILWYIELLSANDTVMKLLADGETGMLYAVKTESSSGLALKDTDMGGMRNPVYWNLFEEDLFCEELLAYLIVSYEAQGWEELSFVREDAYYGDWEIREESLLKMRELVKDAGYAHKDRTFVFQLPYGEHFLDFVLEIGDVNIINNEKTDLTLMYPDVTAGVRDIYELIPEFQ